MAPSPPGARTSPASQRKQIPGTQVLSWHSSERQAKKPRIRRPITACEACRSAKAKCNGQHGCERCKNRGLRCTYATPPNTSGGHGNGSVRAEIVATLSPSVDQPIAVDVAPTAATPVPADQITSHSMSADLSGDLISMAGRDEGAIQPVPASHAMDHWREDNFNQALEQFDWVFPEPDIGLNSPRPQQNEFDFLPTPTGMISGSANDSTRPNSASQSVFTGLPQPPPVPSRSCQCRANMMLQVPKIECAIQEKPKPQLDRMFKVTGDVIRSCLESTRCGCYTGPVDLVCIMTVFEQTAVCFDFIAKSGFDGTVKVGIGDYCVSLTDDVSLKCMLVSDLVKQANELLDSLNELAQNMSASRKDPGFKAMSRSPACLNQLNLNYLREATASFKKLFCLITDFDDANDPDTRCKKPDQYLSRKNV